MWTRKELKDNAKAALKRNYWKVVLVSLLIIVLGGGLNSTFLHRGSGGNGDSQEAVSVPVGEENDVLISKYTLENENLIRIEGNENDNIIAVSDSVAEAVGDAVEDALTAALPDTAEDEEVMTAVLVAFLVVFLVVAAVGFAVVVAVDVFLVNPLCVGAQRFMLKCVDGTGNVGELGFAFDHSYLNNVKVSFYRDMYVFLWTLLFIIPGIYKKYQYYMVDYILAENPDMPYREVLNRSKEMMNGQKWKTFVLDLSFIFWHMLAMFTCGITEIFYVRPYKNLTRASLYRTLCRND